MKEAKEENTLTANGVIDRTALIKRIQERKKTLKKAEKELKEHFVGIDDEIEYIIKGLQTWYIAPELCTRPVIINLFGPTGVGKTDLVRRLVKLLGFKDKYCEIEMGTQSGWNKSVGAGWNRSVGAVLRGHTNIESGKPSVLLIDEIQRFRTVDDEGHDIPDYDMKDIWTLLSDGKLPFKAEIDALMSMLWDFDKPELIKKHKGQVVTKKAKAIAPSKADIVAAIEASREDEEDADEEQKRRYNYYTLNYFKELLRLDTPIEEIATWSDEKKRQIIMERMMDKSIYDEEDYTKMLIFISGNLDEAYGFTRNAKEVDIDADILYNMSKKVSILNIKEALGRRFRPEQISRMGNTHVIYPTLNRSSFEKIIERKIDKVCVDVKQKTDISLTVDKTIRNLIYDNGVFPTQGTRPVFSTISEILEISLPDFILKALIDNCNTIDIKYSNKKIVAVMGQVSSSKPYLGTLDKLKDKNRKSVNIRVLAAVHEAAHAIVHAISFKMAPSQIVATPVSSDMEGFVYSQDVGMSKDMMRKRICVLLAGKEAEKLVFGVENQTSGCVSDLEKATELANSMVRSYAMSMYSSSISGEHQNADVNNDIDSTNAIIENIIAEETVNTRELLNKNRKLLIDVSDPLTKFDKMSPEEFKAICEKNGVKVGIAKSSEEVIYWDYSTKYEEFKNSEKSS